ncbi:MAG: Adaptive-response sensory-kinase SasA [Nitrospirae bacterium]|nr:MAG: putative sensor histidine kinase [Nitrospira sp. OLB3]MBV6469707.1 Adaptive-response sensory-kinase SasA [Nitrospirota bacterium]MCE7966964.1 PAS domain S-box protein [Nitrospira sp. NTP2]MCK6494450.1 ATP-binding protein [Nitrospira sp.]MEB2340097.1 ATP-binding protein [Nitrospirales bacterium]
MSDLLSNLPIARKLFLALVIPALTILILSVLTYRSVTTFSDDEGQLNDIYYSQRLASEYLRLIVDLETGFRGFVLTSQEHYLFPYRTAQDHVLNLGRTLEAQVSPYEDQRDLIASIQQLVKQFIEEKELLIEAVKAEHTEEARLYIEEGKGRSLMLKIRQDMGRLEHLAQAALNQRLAKLAQDRDDMLMTILGGGLFALICMVGSLHLIARSITTPLKRLAKAVVPSEANLVPQVPLMTRTDEIGNLSRVIHAMSTAIQSHVATVEQSEADLRQLNQDLVASEAKYRSIVDHAPFGIFTTRGMTLVFSNRYNSVLAGLDPSEEKDPDAVRRAIHPDDRDRVIAEFAQAVNEGRSYETVFRFLHADGTVRKVLSRRIPIRDATGQVVMYQGFNVDITALDLMQTRLSRAERLATLGQVAAGIAHEIRNPLVGIGSTTMLLLDDTEPQDPRRPDLEVILQETKRLDRIVNQIIDYARPREIVALPFDMAQLVQEVIKVLDEPLSSRKVTAKVAAPSAPYPIQADRDQLKQVLLNVIQNAIEATPPGGTISLALGLQTRRTEAGVEVTVTDRGQGISPAHLPHVFEPFFTSGKPRGTGLGLAICRNILDAHGGDLALESDLGVGTTVRVWCPLRQQLQLQRMQGEEYHAGHDLRHG